jgi:hypothetical protein
MDKGIPAEASLSSGDSDTPVHGQHEKAPDGQAVKKITWEQARDIVFRMIMEEWGDSINGNRTFSDSPPKGLNKKNSQVMALASPINNIYFREYCAQVTVADLDGLKDVYELVDVVLQHIPDICRA